MFGPPGIAYVYLVYGMYDCLNVVTGPAGRASAVLIRAVEPVTGIEAMREARWAVATTRRRRAWDDAARTAARERLDRLPAAKLASGPGAVGAAFGLDRSWTGIDVCAADAPLRVQLASPDAVAAADVVAGPRVGIDYAGPDWAARPWRFHLAGHPSVSRPAR
jgi:DNA-3-methyladenine glycosylase